MNIDILRIINILEWIIPWIPVPYTARFALSLISVYRSRVVKHVLSDNWLTAASQRLTIAMISSSPTADAVTRGIMLSLVSSVKRSLQRESPIMQVELDERPSIDSTYILV